MIPPYQSAAEETRKQSLEVPKTALSIGSSFVGGKLLANKVMPFLNKFIPNELMKKGLSKVSPDIGKFIDSAVNNGYDIEEIRNFIQDKFSPKEEKKKEQPKQNRNIIQQYSPELHQFMDEQIKNGRSPLEAGALAQHDKRFGDAIKKLIKDHKTPWSSILESVYGTGQTIQPQQMQEQQTQQQQPAQGQQQGIDPAVAQILQQGTELLNRMRAKRG